MQRLSVTGVPDTGLSGETKPVWIHALSVGEVISAAPFVNRFAHQFPNLPMVFSSSTQTGFETAIRLVNPKNNQSVRHCYYPYDLAFSVRRMIAAVNPSLAIIVETDIWPGFLRQMKKRNVPVILVNARLSDRSFKGYRRILFFSKQVFSLFTGICVQTDSDAFRFRRLGVPHESIAVCGNFKSDQDSELISEQDIGSHRDRLRIRNGEKVILAGSTHPGEELLLAEAFSFIKSEPDICLMVAPRNPDRSESVRRIFASAGYDVRLYSDLHQTHGSGPGVIIINAIGILKKLYALADIAFVGGSLIDFRGHNPLEPAAYAKPVLFGPFMSDFRYIAESLKNSGGAIQVSDADDLRRIAADLLQDHRKAKEIGNNAMRVLHENRGAIDKTLSVLRPHIMR